MIVKPFSPKWGSNQVLTASASAALATIDANSTSVRVVNSGATNKGYFCTYNSRNYTPYLINGVVGPTAPVATVADCPVYQGTSVVIGKAIGDDSLSYISASGTTLEVMTGDNGV